MQYVLPGKTGMYVSCLCLSSMTFGGTDGIRRLDAKLAGTVALDDAMCQGKVLGTPKRGRPVKFGGVQACYPLAGRGVEDELTPDAYLQRLKPRTRAWLSAGRPTKEPCVSSRGASKR